MVIFNWGGGYLTRLLGHLGGSTSKQFSVSFLAHLPQTRKPLFLEIPKKAFFHYILVYKRIRTASNALVSAFRLSGGAKM